MPIPDMINGSFELLAGIFVLTHCRRVIKDKMVKGVSIISTIFFTLWGFWNLYYYPHLEQWLSFYGGLSIVGANTLWVILMIYYKRQERVLNDSK